MVDTVNKINIATVLFYGKKQMCLKENMERRSKRITCLKENMERRSKRITALQAKRKRSLDENENIIKADAPNPKKKKPNSPDSIKSQKYTKTKHNIKPPKINGVLKQKSTNQNEKSLKNSIIMQQKPVSEMSPYEKLAHDNKLARMKYLEKIGIFDAVKSVAEITQKRKSVNFIKKEKPKSIEPKEVRRSDRIKNIVPKYDTNILESNWQQIEHTASQISNSPPFEKEIEIKKPMAFTEFYGTTTPEEESFMKDSIQSISALEHDESSVKFWDQSTISLPSFFKNMTKCNVAKVVAKRITSLKFHPNTQKPIVFAGSTNGEVGVWDVYNTDANSAIFNFDIHSNCIYGLTFHETNHNVAFTSSYSGSLRKLDLASFRVDEMVNVKDLDVCISCHITSGPNEIILGGTKGFFQQVDLRTKETCIKTLHTGKKIKDIVKHPRENHIIATGGSDGKVLFWDVRKIKPNNPVNELITGACITGMDISDSGDNLSVISYGTFMYLWPWEKLNQTDRINVYHNNNTGRWLTGFRPKWIPGKEMFLTGSMEYPRKIQVYDSTGRNMYNFTHEDIKSVNSLNVFHPKLPILIGGNSSGKVHALYAED